MTPPPFARARGGARREPAPRKRDPWAGGVRRDRAGRRAATVSGPACDGRRRLRRRRRSFPPRGARPEPRSRATQRGMLRQPRPIALRWAWPVASAPSSGRGGRIMPAAFVVRPAARRISEAKLGGRPGPRGIVAGASPPDETTMTSQPGAARLPPRSFVSASGMPRSVQSTRLPRMPRGMSWRIAARTAAKIASGRRRRLAAEPPPASVRALASGDRKTGRSPAGRRARHRSGSLRPPRAPGGGGPGRRPRPGWRSRPAPIGCVARGPASRSAPAQRRRHDAVEQGQAAKDGRGEQAGGHGGSGGSGARQISRWSYRMPALARRRPWIEPPDARSRGEGPDRWSSPSQRAGRSRRPRRAPHRRDHAVWRRAVHDRLWA